jgi:biopolymer transport protein ExbD
MGASGRERKELNFELDLLPVISMMSVCICFLLLTAVWTQVGSLEIKQGLGQEQTRENSSAPSLWITMSDRGAVTLTAMDSVSIPKKLRAMSFTIGKTTESWSQMLNHAVELKGIDPGLKTALIMASPQVNYGDVIKVMDRLKTIGIGEIGFAPL